MAQWLQACHIETVVMQATGVYWMALYQVLESHGLQVYGVNAKYTKTLPGRKTDVLECQWLQKLHTFGLLNNSFLPPEQIRVLRTYLRQRESGGGARDLHSARHQESAEPCCHRPAPGCASLHRSQSYLEYRRFRARLDGPAAITAMAHLLARLIYRLFRYGLQYHDKGVEHYERKYRETPNEMAQ